MTCPNCGRTRHTVIESRSSSRTYAATRKVPHPDSIYRRRCKCGHTWETIEITPDQLLTHAWRQATQKPKNIQDVE
jgi:transcriptional regulator NrdR family protein